MADYAASARTGDATISGRAHVRERPRTEALPATSPWPAHRVRPDGVRRGREEVAAEYALTIRVNARELATIACTPTDLEDLVLGFLTAEGVLCPGDPLARLEVDLEAGMAVVEAPGRDIDTAELGARFVGSCCGKSRLGFPFATDARTAEPVESDVQLEVAECVRLMAALQDRSGLFAATGGVHTAALATARGLDVLRTDIGRHNALDKLYGHALRTGTGPRSRVVVFSGRISSEVLLKAAKMASPILLSKSAPTDLALRLADRLGVTTVGFLRGDSMNVYTHPERLIDLTAGSHA